MSDPKRYEHMSDGMGRWFINPKTGKLAPYGEYVMSSDYARLKAENQGRQAENSVLAIENDCLKAEVERLRASSFVTAVPVEQYERVVNAGDEMHKSMLECGPNEMAEEFDHDRWWASYYAWQAAKEGKQS